MAEYLLTQKAVFDLDEIWHYIIDQWSEKQADDHYNMLMASCEKIAQNPSLGKRYNGIIENLYGLRIGRHIIFYRTPREGDIEVARILYERMDLESRLVE